jgi:hypothetical protein
VRRWRGAGSPGWTELAPRATGDDPLGDLARHRLSWVRTSACWTRPTPDTDASVTGLNSAGVVTSRSRATLPDEAGSSTNFDHLVVAVPSPGANGAERSDHCAVRHSHRDAEMRRHPRSPSLDVGGKLRGFVPDHAGHCGTVGHGEVVGGDADQLPTDLE